MSTSPQNASNPAAVLWVAGFDAAIASVDEADHIGGRIHDETISLGVDATCLWVGTHIVTGAPGLPNRVALSVALAGEPGDDVLGIVRGVLLEESAATEIGEIGEALPGQEATGLGLLADGAAQARDARESKRSGRAIAFPGEESLTGDIPVGELLSRSDIDEVVHLGRPERATAAAHEVIHTRDFVRPVWNGGILELPVTPWDDTRIVPFEDPDPKECCVWHG